MFALCLLCSCGREMVTCMSVFESTFDSRRPVMRDLVPRQRPFS